MKVDFVFEPEGRQLNITQLEEILISITMGGKIRIWKTGDHSDLAIHIDTSDGEEVLINGQRQ